MYHDLNLSKEEAYILDSIAWSLGILKEGQDIYELEKIPPALFYIRDIARLSGNPLRRLRKFDERFDKLKNAKNIEEEDLLSKLKSFYQEVSKNPDENRFNQLLEKYFP